MMSENRAEKPRVSIVIPVYNGKKYAERAVACLRRQTYADTEIIFVNDGSTDGTADEIRICAQRAELPVTVYDKPNGGVSSARNYGLDRAGGEYVCFMDIDDEIAPDFVSTLYNNAADTAADVSLCMAGGILGRGDGVVHVYDNVTALEKILYGKISAGGGAVKEKTVGREANSL